MVGKGMKSTERRNCLNPPRLPVPYHWPTHGSWVWGGTVAGPDLELYRYKVPVKFYTCMKFFLLKSPYIHLCMSFPSYTYLAYTGLNKASYQNAYLCDYTISRIRGEFTTAFYNDRHNKMTFKGAHTLSEELFDSKAPWRPEGSNPSLPPLASDGCCLLFGLPRIMDPSLQSCLCLYVAFIGTGSHVGGGG